MEKRTFVFTHAEIELLQNALNLAELHYNNLFKMITSNVINESDKEAALYYYHKANEIYDFNSKISNSDFDV